MAKEKISEQEIKNLEDIKRKDFSKYTKYLAKKEINPSSIARKIAVSFLNIIKQRITYN